MLQFKIPQNVERDDQITSFLSVKQLIILAVGGAFCYFLYITLSTTFYIEVWGPIVFIPAFITVCIAYVEFGGVGFTKWMFLFAEFVMRPRKRVWGISSVFQDEMKALIVNLPPKKENTPPKNQAPTKTLAEIVNEMKAKKYQETLRVKPQAESDFLDDEEKRQSEHLTTLAQNQKSSGLFSQVVLQENYQVSPSQPSVPVEQNHNTNSILATMQEKIQGTTPSAGV